MNHGSHKSRSPIAIERERAMSATKTLIVLAVCLLTSSCARTRLLIQNEQVVASMPITNTFAEGGEPAPGGKIARAYWTGLLFHVGTYELRNGGLSPYRFTEILLEGPGLPSKRRELPVSDGLYWINIVSSVEVANPDLFLATEPMTPEHALYLYPNAVDLPNDCREDPDPACGCECNGAFTRRLHPYLLPQALITYWRGSSGFVFRGRPAGKKHDGADTEFLLEFRDKVTVHVFKEENGSGTPTMVLQESYRNLDRITVKFRADHQHNQHDDPPWP